MSLSSKLICKYIVKIIQNYFRTRQDQSYRKLILLTKFKKKKNKKIWKWEQWEIFSYIRYWKYIITKLTANKKGHEICRHSWTRTKSINRSPGNCVHSTGGSARFRGQRIVPHISFQGHTTTRGTWTGQAWTQSLSPCPGGAPSRGPQLPHCVKVTQHQVLMVTPDKSETSEWKHLLPILLVGGGGGGNGRWQAWLMMLLIPWSVWPFLKSIRHTFSCCDVGLIKFHRPRFALGRTSDPLSRLWMWIASSRETSRKGWSFLPLRMQGSGELGGAVRRRE